MTDVFVANDGIADVQVRSATQLYVFGKGSGRNHGLSRPARMAASFMPPTSASATTSARSDEMLRLAMPEANVQATPMNNLVLLTGTVASPTDVEEAQRLVQAYVGEGTAGGQPPALGRRRCRSTCGSASPR